MYLTFQGEDKEWQLHWRHLDLNPFSPDRTPLVTPRSVAKTTTTKRPIQSSGSEASNPNPATNQLKRSVVLATLPPLPSLIEEVTTARPARSLPSFLSQKYQDFCELQSMAYTSACCPVDLFEHPEANTLDELGCEAFVIPETMVGSPYYNPLFITQEEKAQLGTNGSVVRLRALYSVVEGLPVREKRQIGLAIAGGSMFGFAVNSILGFFGYSTHTTEDIEHINANQDHIGEVEHHVELAEKFAKQMREEAHLLEKREYMMERLLHVSASMQGIFEAYELYMAGLSVLFQQRALSPLLVDRKEVVRKVRALQHKERGRGNLILMDPLNIWAAELSYVVTRNLNIMVMMHIPVAKQDSFRHLYKYVRTPLAFSKSTTHFFPNPPNSYLLLDKDNSHPKVLDVAELAKCKEMRTDTRYCPAMSYQLNSAPATCLTSLHSGDSLGVLAKCPVSLVDEEYVYVASLGFGKYSVYTRNETKARVFCGTHSIDPIKLVGLMTVTVRKDCRVVGDSFILEPVVDFESVQQVLDSIPVTFSEDQNFTSALDWGKEVGLVSALPDDSGQTMNDIASSWNNDKLEVNREWSIITYIGLAIGVLAGTFICCCVTKECWHCYQRRQDRRGLATLIREQVEMRPMISNPQPSYPVLNPTAPAAT